MYKNGLNHYDRITMDSHRTLQTGRYGFPAGGAHTTTNSLAYQLVNPPYPTFCYASNYYNYYRFTRRITMATFRKVATGWQAQVCKRGVRKASTFKLKAEAQAWANQIEADISAQRAGTIPNKTLADVLDKYGKEVSPTKRGELWEIKRIRVLKGYRISKVRLSELDATHVAKWRDDRLKDVSGSSVCRDWNLLSHACEIARKEWKWIHANPFKGQVTRPKVSPPREKVFTTEEVEAICLSLGSTQVSGRVKDAFMFALETAMRAGEICGIRREDIHDRHVRLPMTKNGSPRDVPLSQKAKEILSKYPDGFGLNTRQLDVLFRRARDNAGVNGRFHDSRHSAITRLASTFNVLELARIVGHKNINQLMTYYNPTMNDLADKMPSC